MFIKEVKNKDDKLIKIAALLIHAAKIDENYSNDEEEIIKQALFEFGLKEDSFSKTMQEAKILENDSNQILDFTKEVKNLPEEAKIKIVETLWSIIYSNKDADVYEMNLMRRLAGLLYIDSKTMGNIKDRIKKENS